MLKRNAKVLAITAIVIVGMVCMFVVGIDHSQLEEVGYVVVPVGLGVYGLVYYVEGRIRTLVIAGLVIAATVAGLVGVMLQIDMSVVRAIDGLAFLAAVCIAWFVDDEDD